MAKPVSVIDPENPPMTDEELASLRPAREVLPPELFARLTRRKPGQRGPGKRPAMALVSLRLPEAVVETFKRSNARGWRADLRLALEREAARMEKAAGER